MVGRARGLMETHGILDIGKIVEGRGFANARKMPGQAGTCSRGFHPLAPGPATLPPF